MDLDFKSYVQREVAALKTPVKKEVAPLPTVGSQAPDSPELRLPRSNPTVIVFLRHVGDPFAEKIFTRLAALSVKEPRLDYIAVSHSDREATDRWVAQVGGAWEVEVVVDTERDLYARWGLGQTTAWQLLNPTAVWNTLQLGREEGIWGRAVESGNRWQNGGAFAVDAMGVVRLVHTPRSSDDLINFDHVYETFGLPVPVVKDQPVKKFGHPERM